MSEPWLAEVYAVLSKFSLDPDCVIVSRGATRTPDTTVSKALKVYEIPTGAYLQPWDSKTAGLLLTWYSQDPALYLQVLCGKGIFARSIPAATAEAAGWDGTGWTAWATYRAPDTLAAPATLTPGQIPVAAAGNTLTDSGCTLARGALPENPAGALPTVAFCEGRYQRRGDPGGLVFPARRRSQSMLYFPIQAVPYRDIFNRVTLPNTKNYCALYDGGAVTRDGSNSLLFVNSAVDWWNEDMAFQRSAYDPFPGRDCTLEFWIYINAPDHASMTLFASQSGWTGSGIAQHLELRLDYSNGMYETVLSTTVGGADQNWGVQAGVAAGQWIHLAVTQAGKQTRLYKNGVLVSETNALDCFADCMNANAWYSVGVPCGAGGYAMSGHLDAFGIYDFAWAPEEVAAVYAAEREQKAV